MQSTDRVSFPFLFGVVGLPSAGGEDVLVPLVPAPEDNFARVRLERSSTSISIFTRYF